MSSLKELTEDTTDRQDSRKLQHLKTYTFHIFYTPVNAVGLSSTLNVPLRLVQKVSLRMPDDKQPNVSDGRSAELNKQLQMQFYCISDEAERKHGLLDLKMAGLESTTLLYLQANLKSLATVASSSS